MPYRENGVTEIERRNEGRQNRERYTDNPRLEIDITGLFPIAITFRLIKGEKYAVVNDFISGGGRRKGKRVARFPAAAKTPHREI